MAKRTIVFIHGLMDTCQCLATLDGLLQERRVMKH